VYNKPEFPPLLPDGLHPMSLAAIEELCVIRFPLSMTRPAIMSGFRQTVKRIVDCGIGGELWINGSFLTKKIDPADIDFCAMIPCRYYDSGTPAQRDVVDWLQSRQNEPKTLYLCDTNAELVYPEASPYHYMHTSMIEHWLQIFGRSVGKGEPKGIAVLQLDQVVL
jgi:hypothetical protein